MVTSEAFTDIGKRIMRRNEGIGKKTFERRFVSNFGMSSEWVPLLWWLLMTNIPDFPISGVEPRHLMWTLLFMKTYDTEARLAAQCECDEKTLRKWIWRVIEHLAALSVHLVSFSKYQIFHCIEHIAYTLLC